MVKLKVGRNIIEIDEKDLILDNGACYQIITKSVPYRRNGLYSEISPVMSKKLFTQLKGIGMIFTNDALEKQSINHYQMSGVTFWKFNIPLMERLGY